MRHRLATLAVSLVVAAGCAGIPSSPVRAAADDRDALSGLKEVKVAFDVKEGDGKALLGRLGIIEETRESLVKQGITPHFVIAFRGPATKLVQTDMDKVKPDDRPIARKIAAKLHDMSMAPGVDSVEQCAVAIRENGTSAEKVVPGVKVVGNAWISLMAYQSKGYAYIAP
jgi:intracellular sulfur oxidation DsrE/DsrF family protein